MKMQGYEEWQTPDLFARYADGQTEALGEIWRRHHERMRRIAAGNLRTHPELTPLYEPDDFLDETFARLTRRALDGSLTTSIHKSNDFWMIFRKTLRQAILDACDRAGAIKRGGHGVRKSDGGRKRAFLGGRKAEAAVPDDLDLIASSRPGPDAIAMTEEILERLFGLLDPEQALIARLRLSNRSIPEIAESMGVSERSIARRLKEIRRIWERSKLID